MLHGPRFSATASVSRSAHDLPRMLAQQRLAVERPRRLVLEAHDGGEMLAAVVGHDDRAALQEVGIGDRLGQRVDRRRSRCRACRAISSSAPAASRGRSRRGNPSPASGARPAIRRASMNSGLPSAVSRLRMNFISWPASTSWRPSRRVVDAIEGRAAGGALVLHVGLRAVGEGRADDVGAGGHQRLVHARRRCSRPCPWSARRKQRHQHAREAVQAAHQVGDGNAGDRRPAVVAQGQRSARRSWPRARDRARRGRDRRRPGRRRVIEQ